MVALVVKFVVVAIRRPYGLPTGQAEQIQWTLFRLLLCNPLIQCDNQHANASMLLTSKKVNKKVLPNGNFFYMLNAVVRRGMAKPKVKNPAAVALRAQGVAKTSPKRRREIARNAARARWSNQKKGS